MSSLNKFWLFVKDVQSLNGWIVKSAFAAPLLPIILNLGPPWDADTPEKAKGSLAIITAIVQMFGLTSAFAFCSIWNPEKVKRMLYLSLYCAASTMFMYLAAFVFLSEQPQQPRYQQRYVTGFVKTNEYYLMLRHAANDTETAKDFLKRDPLKIWEPWTVYISYFILCITWLIFFGSLSYYVGIFVIGSNILHGGQSVIELALPTKLNQELANSGIVTIDDLISKTKHELMEIPKIGEAKAKLIQDALLKYGRCLRGDSLK